MNNEQKIRLIQGLCNLIAAQSTVLESDAAHKEVAIRNRYKIRDAIVDFVDSLIVGKLDTIDPRSEMRTCKTAAYPPTKSPGHPLVYFHGWYTDVDSSACALLELPNGQLFEAYWGNVQFTDIPEVSE